MATAKDVALSTIEEIYKADCKKNEWENYYACAKSLASEIEAYMVAQATITEEAKQAVVEKLGNSVNVGDIVGIPIKDYTGKRPDGTTEYDYLLGEVRKLKRELNGDQAKNLNTAQLKQYVETLNGEYYPAATKLIFHGIMNMSNAFSRQNIAEEIIDFFEEHDFGFSGSAYEDDRHDGALHFGVKNDDSGEEIVITLAPELMPDGMVQTRLEINQLAGDEANEDRKKEYRDSIEEAVKGGTPGAQITLMCKAETKNKLSEKQHLRDRLQS